MSWEETFDSYDSLVEERLKGFFVEVVKEAREYHPFIGKVYEDLEEFTLRKGKRMASYTTLITYKGYNGKIDDNIFKVCAGIELYRHSILIHDDLVDMDNLRREGKTLHRTLAKNYDSRFGEGTSVFIGNIAYALAMRAILLSGFPREKVAECLLLLSRGYQEVNESQLLDLLFEYKDVSVDEWEIMASKRAASLFKITLLIGAILGDASENNLRLLEKAAVQIGYAFDIQDDIIDTFAQPEQYGRSTCGDVVKGKKPLHIVCALNSAEEEKSRAIKKIIGKKHMIEEEKELVRKAIRQSGGLEAARKTSKKHAKEAKKLIAQTDLNDQAKKFFNRLVYYIEKSLGWYK